MYLQVNSLFNILVGALIYVSLISVDCTKNYKKLYGNDSVQVNSGGKNSFNVHQLELGNGDSVKPHFLYFPSKSNAGSSSSSVASSKSDNDFISDSSSINARIGTKFPKIKSSSDNDGGYNSYSNVNEKGDNNGQVQMKPLDFWTQFGRVLGIAGLGILFIAEVSSSFAAPFLIPVLLVPLGFVVLLRFFYDELNMGQVDLDMYV